MLKWIRAWIYKYILGIASPSAHWLGYKYEWDMIRDRKRFNKIHGHYIKREIRKWSLPDKTGGDE